MKLYLCDRCGNIISNPLEMNLIENTSVVSRPTFMLCQECYSNWFRDGMKYRKENSNEEITSSS